MDIGVQRLQANILRREHHQLGAQIHQKLHPLAELVELAEKLDPRRHQGLAQIALGAASFDLVAGFLARQMAAVHRFGLHVVVPRQNLEEAPPALGIQHQIGLAQIRGAGAGRYLAAAGFQTGVDLPAQAMRRRRPADPVPRRP